MKIALALALMASGAQEPRDGSPAGMRQALPSDFDFAAAWDSPCVPSRNRRGPDPAYANACEDWSEPQYFHGLWTVGFEESNFTFMGKMDCYKMRDQSCIDLRGKALPWPGRWDCNREFELKFIGRRTRYAVPSKTGLGTPYYAVTVDRLIYARRLPPPYNWTCPSAPVDETD